MSPHHFRNKQTPARLINLLRPKAAAWTIASVGILWMGLAGCGVQARPPVVSDVVVYAATPSGIMAAIEAAQLGKKVTLLEPTRHIGGMSTNGLGSTDLYTTSNGSGLPKAFFQTVMTIYGPGSPAETASHHGTRYSPRVAEQAFQQMLAQQPNVRVIFGVAVLSVFMNGSRIDSMIGSDRTIYQAQEFIDASYGGDLMAVAKVKYTVGRESNQQYHETYNGVEVPFLSAGLHIDPYVVPGTPASGLLPHVFPDTMSQTGSADKAVMAYSYRLCLSSDPSNQVPFSAPDAYDPREFEFLGRQLDALRKNGEPVDISLLLNLTALPDNKFDANSGYIMSTDEVEASYAYPDGPPSVRQGIEAEHKRYTQAILYFLITDHRIPAAPQALIKSLGYCKDEFIDNGGFPHQLYVREARRMIGAYVMTEHDVFRETSIPDSIGVGGYSIDCHGVHRVNIGGAAHEEGLGVALTIGGRNGYPYPISYRALVPQPGTVDNLLVSVAVSASHSAYDSLRVEPAFMIMGQAAGAAASLAIDEKAAAGSVDYSALSSQLKADGVRLQFQ